MRKIICRILPVLLLVLMSACALADRGWYDLPELRFIETHFYGGQTIPVHSGPGSRYPRMAGGYAKVSTNDVVYAAGWENGWLLINYSISGGERVGYIHEDDISGGQSDGVWGGADRKPLTLAYSGGTITDTCQLTDDPSQLYGKTICTMYEGTNVTMLATYHNGFNWTYIETVVDGKLVRGFVPEDCAMVY